MDYETRNWEIVEHRRQGMTYRAMSEKYGISKQRVRDIIARQKQRLLWAFKGPLEEHYRKRYRRELGLGPNGGWTYETWEPYRKQMWPDRPRLEMER